MAKITFKGKVKRVFTPEGALAWQYIAVPALTRNHCDMNAFRQHPKFGSYANSDLFPAMLARIAKDVFGDDGKTLRLDRIPKGVAIDTRNFLATVSFDV
jgi:hypothetical protein